MNFLIHLIEDFLAKSTVKRFANAEPQSQKGAQGYCLRPPKANQLAGWLVLIVNAGFLVLIYLSWNTLNLGARVITSAIFGSGFLAGCYILLSTMKYIIIGDLEFEYRTLFGNTYKAPYSQVIRFRYGSNFLHVYTLYRHFYIDLSLGKLYRLTDRITGYSTQ